MTFYRAKIDFVLANQNAWFDHVSGAHACLVWSVVLLLLLVVAFVTFTFSHDLDSVYVSLTLDGEEIWFSLDSGTLI